LTSAEISFPDGNTADVALDKGLVSQVTDDSADADDTTNKASQSVISNAVQDDNDNEMIVAATEVTTRAPEQSVHNSFPISYSRR